MKQIIFINVGEKRKFTIFNQWLGGYQNVFAPFELDLCASFELDLCDHHFKWNLSLSIRKYSIHYWWTLLPAFVGICLFIICEWAPLSLLFLQVEFKVTGQLNGHASKATH